MGENRILGTAHFRPLRVTLPSQNFFARKFSAELSNDVHVWGWFRERVLVLLRGADVLRARKCAQCARHAFVSYLVTFGALLDCNGVRVLVLALSN
jgi:hypothetical protein